MGFMSGIPKDLGNVSNGTPTYGLFEYISYLDGVILDSWMTLASTGNMGLTFGLILTTCLTRFVLMPPTLYSQIVGYKMKLL